MNQGVWAAKTDRVTTTAGRGGDRSGALRAPSGEADQPGAPIPGGNGTGGFSGDATDGGRETGGVAGDYPSGAGGVAGDYPSGAGGVAGDYPAGAGGVAGNYPSGAGGVGGNYPAGAGGVGGSTTTPALPSCITDLLRVLLAVRRVPQRHRGQDALLRIGGEGRERTDPELLWWLRRALLRGGPDALLLFRSGSHSRTRLRDRLQEVVRPGRSAGR